MKSEDEVRVMLVKVEKQMDRVQSLTDHYVEKHLPMAEKNAEQLAHIHSALQAAYPILHWLLETPEAMNPSRRDGITLEDYMKGVDKFITNAWEKALR